MPNLDGACHLVGTETSRADIDVFVCTVYNSLDPSDIGLYHAVASSVRVGNFDTEGRTFPADITLRHILHLL